MTPNQSQILSDLLDSTLNKETAHKIKTLYLTKEVSVDTETAEELIKILTDLNNTPAPYRPDEKATEGYIDSLFLLKSVEHVNIPYQSPYSEHFTPELFTTPATELKAFHENFKTLYETTDITENPHKPH